MIVIILGFIQRKFESDLLTMSVRTNNRCDSPTYFSILAQGITDSELGDVKGFVSHDLRVTAIRAVPVFWFHATPMSSASETRRRVICKQVALTPPCLRSAIGACAWSRTAHRRRPPTSGQPPRHLAPCYCYRSLTVARFPDRHSLPAPRTGKPPATAGRSPRPSAAHPPPACAETGYRRPLRSTATRAAQPASRSRNPVARQVGSGRI